MQCNIIYIIVCDHVNMYVIQTTSGQSLSKTYTTSMLLPIVSAYMYLRNLGWLGFPETGYLVSLYDTPFCPMETLNDAL